MTRQEYDAIDAEHFSTLKELARSPSHYKAAKLAPRDATDAMDMGTAFHLLTLEPEKEGDRLAVWDDVAPKPSGLYAAYAKAHGRTSAEQWALDVEEFSPHPLAGLWGWLALRKATFEVRVAPDYTLKEDDVPMFECWLGVSR